MADRPRAWHVVVLWSATVGCLALAELLGETRFGFDYLTTGSPLIYRGVLLELPGVVWFLALFGLEAWASRAKAGRDSGRVHLYVFVWSILGLAVALWASKHADQNVRSNWQYIVASSCIAISFVASAMRELASPFAPATALLLDARSLITAPRFWAMVGIAGVIVAFGPRPNNVTSRRVKPLHGQALLDWFDHEPRHAVPGRSGKALITVATFLDYQCPSCASADGQVAPLVKELKATYGEAVEFTSVDFPLNTACNPNSGIPNIHPLACDEAALVRTMRESGRSVDDVVRWLWANQAKLDKAELVSRFRAVTGEDFEGPRAKHALADVRQEATSAYQMGVRATPMYAVNGVVMRRTLPEELKMIIAHEMQRVGASRSDR